MLSSRGTSLRAGDFLIQRFKALETSVIDGNWVRARHHEIVPEEGVGLAPLAERRQKQGLDSAASDGANMERRRVSRQVDAQTSAPSQVPKLKSETAKIEGSQKRQGLRQAAVVDQQVGDASSGGVSRMWTKEPPLEKEVDISSAQGALSANNSWSRADAAASLHHLQKTAEGGLSVETLGVACYRGTGVAPWRFRSRNAADLVHD